jgi:hypothetical protein
MGVRIENKHAAVESTKVGGGHAGFDLSRIARQPVITGLACALVLRG